MVLFGVSSPLSRTSQSQSQYSNHPISIGEQRSSVECDALRERAVASEKLVTQLMEKQNKLEQEKDELLMDKIVTDQERDALVEELEHYKTNELRMKQQIADMTKAKDAQIAALRETEKILIEQVQSQNAELMDKLNRMAADDDHKENEDEMNEMIRCHEIERTKLKEELKRVRDTEKAL